MQSAHICLRPLKIYNIRKWDVFLLNNLFLLLHHWTKFYQVVTIWTWFSLWDRNTKKIADIHLSWETLRHVPIQQRSGSIHCTMARSCYSADGVQCEKMHLGIHTLTSPGVRAGRSIFLTCLGIQGYRLVWRFLFRRLELRAGSHNWLRVLNGKCLQVQGSRSPAQMHDGRCRFDEASATS